MTATGGIVAFAAASGFATFLSPCALPLLPGYVGYYLRGSETEDGTLAGVVVRGIAAAVGVFGTLALLAGLVVLAGQSISQHLGLLEPLVGVALIALGVYTLAAPGSGLSVTLPERRRGTAGFLLFGAGYAGASAGCVLPVFLAIVFEAITLSPAAGLAVVGVYAGAVALPLLVVTLVIGFGVDVATGRLAQIGSRLERVAGVVLVLAGIGQIVIYLNPSVVP